MDLAVALRVILAAAPLLYELVQAIEAHRAGDDGADARLKAAIDAALAHNAAAKIAADLDAEIAGK